MTTPCHACPLRQNPAFEDFTPQELAFMERFKIGELTIEPGRTILMQGAQSPQFYTVLRGQGLRAKMLEDGRRQVISFVLPGDLVGLQAMVMREMQHSVEASTEVTLCVFDRAGLWDLFASQPQRAYSLTWLSAVEENFLGETVATLGQRDAVQRIAWALVRLHDRLTQLDLSVDGWVPMPWRQQDLADAMGLSLVHTNKTLARMRAERLAIWQGRRLALPARDMLAELAAVEAEGTQPRPLL